MKRCLFISEHNQAASSSNDNDQRIPWKLNAASAPAVVHNEDETEVKGEDYKPLVVPWNDAETG